ncbi:MAG TPA: KEOPS complex N(6)-L-threonylcarbamoyladenine synthase Kae1 [Candidatus Woesearchaeota archaeon]|nr:KEOPS complex N(6)-L-threonylcarbamoyladenine synthase Kae1 [Candidatus Woesearchaeota archaeon]
MLCLGIESTAHTFGVGIVSSEKSVLSNEKVSYKTHEGGMIPAKVADFLVENCQTPFHDALKKANLSIKDIDLISFSQGPGMGHSLRVGAVFARALSSRYNIPIIGVNHCIAHLEIGKMLTPAKDPVLLYVSGANTQIIAFEAGKYKIFGESIDMGVGNFIDAFARYLKLGFPGGPKVEEFAKQGHNYIPLPYVVKGMDVSFGGILTNLKKKYDSKKYTLENLCFSMQETVFAMLLEVTERAMAHCEKDELLLGGGVACNTRLSEMAKTMCFQRGAKCFILENQYNVDNPAMIAWLGIKEYLCGKRQNISQTQIRPYWRTDEV